MAMSNYELDHKWQREAASQTTSDNMWLQVATGDYEWIAVLERVKSKNYAEEIIINIHYLTKLESLIYVKIR